jgi:DNA-binding MarR family transcriptional regulator
LFLATHAEIVARIEVRLAAHELPDLACYDVLWALERSQGQRLRMSELAGALVISRSNLTRLADRLEAAGLIRRERDAEDRRGAYAVLTKAGRKLRQKMWPVYREAITDLFARHVADQEAAVLAKAFRRMLRAMRETGGPSSIDG